MTEARTGSLQGKIALITGAARGIGRASAIALAKEGVSIIGIDICAPVCAAFGVTPSTQDDLKETGRQVQAVGGSWLSFILDQRNIKALRDTAEQIVSAFGGIDIVFANAGVQGFKSLLEMDDEHWNTHIDVNLTGTANVVRVFTPYLIKRGGGRIIVTSSTQGQHGTKYGAAYSASKWGIISLMKSASLELGKYNITVNAIVPGLINTPLTRHEERYAQVLQDACRQVSGSDENEAKKLLIAKTPLGIPWIEPEDIASVVVFLASNAARMVSGATFDVTAGDSGHNAV